MSRPHDLTKYRNGGKRKTAEKRGEAKTVSGKAQVIQLRGPSREKSRREQDGGQPVHIPVQARPERDDAEVNQAKRLLEAPGVALPPPTAITPPARTTETTEGASVPSSVVSALSFLRHRLTGDYTVDEFGFDAELTATLLLPPLRVLYERWFRVTTHGTQNLPLEGGALLVSNHSGTVPLDALMTLVAVHEATPGNRYLRGLGADLIFNMPLVGSLARKSGQTLACTPDAERLLGNGELVGVWPEGYKGIGKPFSSRYKLQRFGRGGFVSAALRAGVPIIPVSIVGAEETYPKVGDIKLLARMFGLPYFPVTPFFPLLGPLGAIPLPTKWSIEFGEPIHTEDFDTGAENDPMLVFTLTDQVRESIQQALYKRLAQRQGIFRS